MIPKIVHFAFFYPSDFPLYGCLAVKSAQKFLAAEKIFLYRSASAPDIQGEWWDRTKDAVQIIKIQPPTQVYGNPLKHPAHQADVVRLQVLLDEGGIYLDLDTICCASFDRLLHHKCVMGHQTEDQSYGLCNAVILAERKSVFLQRWLEEYRSFRSNGLDEYWDEHSVKVPLKLARNLNADDRGLIHIEPRTTFFAAGFQGVQLARLFETCEDFPQSLAHHLWAGYSYKRYLSRLCPQIMLRVPTTYNLLARKVMQLADVSTQFEKPVSRQDPIAQEFVADFVFKNRPYRLIGPDKNDPTISSICRKNTFVDLEVLQFIRERHLQGTYVDVGAKIGNHSVFFLRETKCSELVSIEADQRLIPFLQRNVAPCDKDGSSVRVLNAVISSQGCLFFNPGESVEDGYGAFVSKVCLGEGSLAIEPQTIGKIVNGKSRIVFLRLRAEGHLLDVLKSAETLLRCQKPEICLNVSDLVCEDVYQLMLKYDYLPLITFPGKNVYYVRFPHFVLVLIMLVNKLPKCIVSRVVWRFVRLLAVFLRGFPLKMFNRSVPWYGPITCDSTRVAKTNYV